MRSIRQLATDLVARALPAMQPDDARILSGDLRSGEFEVAAISALEAAPQLATRDDLRDLKLLAEEFDSLDKLLALRLVDRLSATCPA